MIQLFVLYSQPLSKIIQHHSLYHNSFSDANQFYISANLSQLQEIIRASQSCTSDVQAWKHSNKLHTTEMILITSKHNQKSVSLPFSVDLNGTSIQGSSVELLSLITYLPSFTLFTGFLLNKELNTNCFSLPVTL